MIHPGVDRSGNSFDLEHETVSAMGELLIVTTLFAAVGSNDASFLGDKSIRLLKITTQESHEALQKILNLQAI